MNRYYELRLCATANQFLSRIHVRSTKDIVGDVICAGHDFIIVVACDSCKHTKPAVKASTFYLELVRCKIIVDSKRSVFGG